MGGQSLIIAVLDEGVGFAATLGVSDTGKTADTDLIACRVVLVGRFDYTVPYYTVCNYGLFVCVGSRGLVHISYEAAHTVVSILIGGDYSFGTGSAVDDVTIGRGKKVTDETSYLALSLYDALGVAVIDFAAGHPADSTAHAFLVANNGSGAHTVGNGTGRNITDHASYTLATACAGYIAVIFNGLLDRGISERATVHSADKASGIGKVAIFSCSGDITAVPHVVIGV